MKKLKVLLATLLSVALTFSAIFYTSCHKDPCSGVSCLNGGACSNGSCLCPAGYTGSQCQDLAITTITYVNNTFTPVVVNITGINGFTIPVGGSQSITGNYTASASGTGSTGGSFGETIEYSFNNTFPASGTTVVNIDVSSNYFYLLVQNNSIYTITDVNVNHLLTGVQTDESIIIAPDGNTYGIGYYQAFANSNVYLFANSKTIQWNYPNVGALLPFTNNQSYTAMP